MLDFGSFVGWLVGWVAAAVNRIHNTIDWNFTVVFADVIELYLQHNPKNTKEIHVNADDVM